MKPNLIRDILNWGGLLNHCKAVVFVESSLIMSKFKPGATKSKNFLLFNRTNFSFYQFFSHKIHKNSYHMIICCTKTASTSVVIDLQIYVMATHWFITCHPIFKIKNIASQSVHRDIYQLLKELHFYLSLSHPTTCKHH